MRLRNPVKMVETPSKNGFNVLGAFNHIANFETDSLRNF